MQPGNLNWKNDKEQIARLYYLATSFEKWKDGSDLDSEISTLINGSGDPFKWFRNHTGMKVDDFLDWFNAQGMNENIENYANSKIKLVTSVKEIVQGSPNENSLDDLIPKNAKDIVYEIENPATQTYIDFKRDVFTRGLLPWYFQDDALKADNNRSFMVHTILHMNEDGRSKINSHIFDMALQVAMEILNYNDIYCSEIFRIALNSTGSRKDAHSNPHVDHMHSHKVLMLYLSNSEGNTLVCRDKYGKDSNGILDEASSFHLPNDSIGGSEVYPGFTIEGEKTLEVIAEIMPTEDRTAIFDGLHYHCHKFPPAGENRFVMIVTFNDEESTGVGYQIKDEERVSSRPHTTHLKVNLN